MKNLFPKETNSIKVKYEKKKKKKKKTPFFITGLFDICFIFGEGFKCKVLCE